ncbi:hypothetical protein GDO81_029920, partial [Engystomops pustulosus]
PFPTLSRCPSHSKAMLVDARGRVYPLADPAPLSPEWSQRDLDRDEQVKFCRQYIVFHDNNAVVYAGACGNGSEIKGELLSRESPSGALKAVLRETKNKSGAEVQFLEVWDRNRKVKSISLTALDKHGKVYEDEQFGCLSWSHSETHLLYIAEHKRPKSKSFFDAADPITEEEEGGATKTSKGEQFVLHEDWGEGLVDRSLPVLCVLDIESGNISVLEGIPNHVSPGQVSMWPPPDNLPPRVTQHLPLSRPSGPRGTRAWCLWAGGTSPTGSA